MNRKSFWRWLLERITGRESGRRRRQRELILRHLDDPHPPKTYNHQMSFSPGFRWLLRGDISVVKRVIASRPYELVFEATGSHRDLVERGVVTEEQLGLPFEPRARASILKYRRTESSRPPEGLRLEPRPQDPVRSTARSVTTVASHLRYSFSGRGIWAHTSQPLFACGSVQP